MLILLVLAMAQTGQDSGRPGWPCVPGRAVDPAYLEISESTGGQAFLLQKNEAVHTGVIMNLPVTHPETLFRAVGHLAGSRTFEFPVDASIESLSVTASIQCWQAVAVIEPGGTEMTAANAVQNIELQAGKIVRVDGPGVGNWQVRIAGQGLFILSVRAKTSIRLSNVRFAEQTGQMTAAVRGPIVNASFHVMAASGEPLRSLAASPLGDNGDFQLNFTPSTERFRIMVEGTDEIGRPVRRMFPKLFRFTAPQPAHP